MRSKYTCNKCNHGDCNLTVDDNEGVGVLDMPTICPYDTKQMANWKLEG